MEAVRVIKEMRDKSGGLYPTFAVWENVPGAFSSNGGEDFRAVLEELARIVEPEVSVSRPAKGKWAKAGFICGDGWSVAWRTFDAQFWGVPQRRRRIALVVDFGGQRAGEILFERTGVSGHLEPSIPPWKGIARNPAHGTAGHDTVVEGAGAYTLKIRSGCEGGGKGPLVQTEKSATLSTLQDQTLFVAAFTAGQGAKANGIGWAEEQAPTLRTGGGLSDMLTVLCRADANTNSETCENISPTIKACNDGPPIVFQEKYAPDVAHALRAKSNCSFREDAETFIVESIDCRNHRSNGDMSGTLQAKESGGFSLNYINPVAVKKLRWIVRRLTPTECERLQGFPSGWTDIGEWVDSKGKRHKPSDSPRYKALGNSIALPQWWWLTCKMAAYLPEHATLGSLFDGIGGFPLVWETRHGKGTALWASEIEEFPIAVTKRRFGE